MWFIIVRLIATGYVIAPFAALGAVFIAPPLALIIFMVWLISAATMIGLTIIASALALIWRE